MSNEIFLTAEWRHLAMLNYEIDPRILSSLVPAGTELDSWNGRTLVSVVGFMFLNTRVLGMTIPFHQHFEEVNLRFYVRRRSAEGWRRGVVFIKEIVPKRMIAWVARKMYNENYTALPMRHQLANRAAKYEWQNRGRWNHLQVETTGEPALPNAGSEEEFISEHYWGYVTQRDGSTVEYQVEHPQWTVGKAKAFSLKCDVSEIYGTEFVECLSHRAGSAFLTEGSSITVKKGVNLK